MKRFLALAATAASLLGAGAAQAGSVNWSIGLELPHVATVVSGGPGYYAPRRIYGPVVPAYYEPEVVLPAPVYVTPPVVRVHRPHGHFWAPPLPHHRIHAPHWRGHHWRGHDRQQHQWRGHDRRHHDGRGGNDRHRGGRHDRR